MKIFPSLLLLLLLTVSVPSVNADIVISLDLSPNDSGEQTSRSAVDGSNLEVIVGMEIDSATDSVSAYGFRIRFDSEELTLISNTQTPPENFSLGEDSNNRSGSDDARLGLGTPYAETSIGAADFRGFPEGIVGPVKLNIATLVFQVNDPKSDGLDLVTSVNPVFDGLFDNDFEFIPEDEIRFGSASINAIPEPSSGLIFVLGVVAVGTRRKRREVKA